MARGGAIVLSIDEGLNLWEPDEEQTQGRFLLNSDYQIIEGNAQTTLFHTGSYIDLQ